MVFKLFHDIYKNLLHKLETGEDTVLLTHMKPSGEAGGVILNKLIISKDNIEGVIPPYIEESQIINIAAKALETGVLQLFNINDEGILIEPYFPKPRLIIFGGGHIAKPLAEFGTKVGFSVSIVDDRPSFANKTRFPEANQVICDSFENSFSSINPRKSDFIVIVTRGHRHDEVCLRAALKYNTAYIGMIGSKRRVKAMKAMLLNEGYSAGEMERVNSPIGLEIGAVTPDEIAVSIIAEVISYRRLKGNKAGNGKKFNLPEFDQDVIEKISFVDNTPKALVTIISAKGSVPRKSGAKMIIWQDGRTLGSIGGGCSEASVISIARDICATKGYTIHHVDMTGDVAEDEGMVCGGIMDVLIEAL